LLTVCRFLSGRFELIFTAEVRRAVVLQALLSEAIVERVSSGSIG
jgi:hypothetical protein